MSTFYKISFLAFFLLSINYYPQIKIDSLHLLTEFYGPFNKTTAEFFLYNPTNLDSIEGSIRFTVNNTAFIENLWLEIGGELKQARTLRKDQAERIYNLITRKRIDPALLIKTGNGQYTLQVFPFLKNQRRKVVIEYYSVLENDDSDFPAWYFIPYPLPNNKTCLEVVSVQEENVRLLKTNNIQFEKILLKNTGKNNFTLINENSYKINFDFTRLKRFPCYYSSSLKFYQLKNKLTDSIPHSKKYCLKTSAAENYPPDFINKLIKQIKTGRKPSVIAYDQDKFLDGFLSHLEKNNKIYFRVTKTRSNFTDVVNDFNWYLKNNFWWYVDESLVLSQKAPKGKKSLTIQCPFLNKYIQYLEALNTDSEAQIEKGFLNSNLAKIVIEEDKRTIEIWESVTGLNYELIETGNWKEKLDPLYCVAVEEMPVMVGGMDTIKNSLFIPEILKGSLTKAKSYILIKINKTGNIVELEIMKPPYPESDQFNPILEKLCKFAICFPQWLPGKQRGVNVPVKISIPIVIQSDSLTITSDTVNQLKEYSIDGRTFSINVPDITKCYLVEKGFKKNSSRVILYNSHQFYELLFKNPGIINAIYKSLNLCSFDGFGFVIHSNKKENHIFIKR